MSTQWLDGVVDLTQKKTAQSLLSTTNAFKPSIVELEQKVQQVQDVAQLKEVKNQLLSEEQALRQQLEALGSDSDESGQPSSAGDTSLSD